MPDRIQKFENEHDLLEASRQGNRHVFKQIYDIYRERVYSLAYYMCKNIETAEDLTQQIFLKAYLALDSFKGSAQFGTWLFRLAMNTCIDEQRKKRKNEIIPLAKVSPDIFVAKESADDRLQQKEISQAIEKSILNLSDTLRSTFVLRYISELSYSEISETLGCSVGTVSSRLNSCLKILAHELKDFK